MSLYEFILAAWCWARVLGTAQCYDFLCLWALSVLLRCCLAISAHLPARVSSWGLLKSALPQHCGALSLSFLCSVSGARLAPPRVCCHPVPRARALAALIMARDAAAQSGGPCPNQESCHGNYSVLCTSQPKLCGTCCACPNHAHRRRRGGKTKGRSSKAARHSRILGLRVSLLETLLDHIVGSDAQELKTLNITSRRMLRCSVIELFIREADVSDAALHDRWDIAWFLRFSPRGLIETVQRHVVAVAAKLKYEHHSTASASSSILPVGDDAPPPPPPEPGLLDEVASSMDVASVADDGEFATDSGANVLALAARPADALHYPLMWWLEVIAGSNAPRRMLPPELVFRQHGRFPWDTVADTISAHLYRQSGAQVPRWLGGQNLVAMKQHIDAGSPYVNALAPGSLKRAAGTLHSWLMHRPALRESLVGTVRLVDPLIMKNFEPTGVFFTMDCHAAGNIPHTYDQRGFHATSLYTLSSVAQNGLGAGWSFLQPMGTPLKGIYNHVPERVNLCNSYMLHTAVDDSGWFFGPMLEIRYCAPDPQGRPTTARRSNRATNQNIAYPDAHVVVALCFHAVHWEHFKTMEKSHGHYVEGLFQREWEIDPTASFEESVAHSTPST